MSSFKWAHLLLCTTFGLAIATCFQAIAQDAGRFALQLSDWEILQEKYAPILQDIGQERLPATTLYPTATVDQETLSAIDLTFNSLSMQEQETGLQTLMGLDDPVAKFAAGIGLQADWNFSTGAGFGPGFEKILSSAEDDGIPSAQLLVDEIYIRATNSLDMWSSIRSTLEASYNAGQARGAESVLAQYFQFGFGGPVDLDQAERFWLLAIQSKNPANLFGYGLFLRETGRFDEGNSYIAQAAEMEYEDAIVASFDQAFGSGDPTFLEEELRNLIEAARKGKSKPAIRAGDYFRAQEPPDVRLAEEFYRIAMNANYGPDAMRAKGTGRLGLLYLDFPEEYAGFQSEAVRLLHSASNRGDGAGLFGLARYAFALQQYPRAYALAARAAESGDPFVVERATELRFSACSQDSRLECLPVPIFFATNRKPAGEPPSDFLGTQAENNLASVGVIFANTSISSNTLDQRLTQFSAALEVVSRLTGEQLDEGSLTGSSDRIVVFDQPVREIIKTINEVYSQYDEEDAFIFIHGFNVSFGAAARLTAETIERADFPAVPFLLSWPSRANPLQYTPDMGAVSSSCQPLQPVLQAVGDEFSGPRLTVMAHSMGGKLAMTMIGGCPAAGIFHWQSADEIGAVVYAATDVSKTDFKQTFPTQSAAVSSLTLYASAEDLALKASSSWG